MLINVFVAVYYICGRVITFVVKPYYSCGHYYICGQLLH